MRPMLSAPTVQRVLVPRVAVYGSQCVLSACRFVVLAQRKMRQNHLVSVRDALVEFTGVTDSLAPTTHM